MTTPSPTPEKSTSGIAVDPKTLNRIVPESRRPDGSIRKEIKIRPGYTPREDLMRFRGSRQTQMDRIALPEGHILGWVAPSSSSKPKPSETGSPTSKSAKKNEKRKAKRDKIKEEVIKANWDDEEETAVKDADGAPNWAKTAEIQDRKAEPRTFENKATTEEHEALDKVNGNGEPSTCCPGQKLEQDDDDEEEDVIKDADGAPNWAKTAEVQDRKGKSNAPGNKAATKEHEGLAYDTTNGQGESPTHGAEEPGQKPEYNEQDVVKDADGTPNWAKTAEVQDRKAGLSTSRNKEVTGEYEELALDKVNGNGEPSIHGAEDLGQVLEQLQLG